MRSQKTVFRAVLGVVGSDWTPLAAGRSSRMSSGAFPSTFSSQMSDLVSSRRARVEIVRSGAGFVLDCKAIDGEGVGGNSRGARSGRCEDRGDCQALPAKGSQRNFVPAGVSGVEACSKAGQETGPARRRRAPRGVRG